MTTGGRLSVPPETLVGLRRRLDAMPGRHPDDRVSLSVVFPLSSPLALSGEQPTLWPPDAWIDESKTKLGYEIPFNRQFYVFEPPRPLEAIDADLAEVMGHISTMIRELAA